MKTKSFNHIVIVGGGFAGLYVAKSLRRTQIEVTLVDKRNFHLFQPLLYQVATGWLSPGDIASPLRAVFHNNKNITVLMAEVTDIIPNEHKLICSDGELSYDTLVVATGTIPSYYGNDAWIPVAPGLKTIEDAIEMRSRILLAFEMAERESDPSKRNALLTFVIVGGGATGVELAGTIAELARIALKDDFRSINPTETKIILIESTDKILPSYPPELSARAAHDLMHLGVSIQTEALVVDIQDNMIVIRQHEQVKEISANTVIWAGGTKGTPIGQVLASRTGATLDRAGRVIVEPDLTIPNYPDIFIVGDLAHFAHQNGKPLPGAAQVAMQQGRYVANLIKKRLKGQKLPAFHYKDKGSLAIIGRNEAVANMGWLKLHGFPAWLLWIFVHITYLIEFDNKLLVLIQWTWNYITHKRGSRLITGNDPFSIVKTYNKPPEELDSE
jgi:NADH dehydrogenase